MINEQDAGKRGVKKKLCVTGREEDYWYTIYHFPSQPNEPFTSSLPSARRLSPLARCTRTASRRSDDLKKRTSSLSISYYVVFGCFCAQWKGERARRDALEMRKMWTYFCRGGLWREKLLEETRINLPLCHVPNKYVNLDVFLRF